MNVWNYQILICMQLSHIVPCSWDLHNDLPENHVHLWDSYVKLLRTLLVWYREMHIVHAESTYARKNEIYLFYTIKIKMVYERSFGGMKKEKQVFWRDLTWIWRQTVCVPCNGSRETTNENAHRRNTTDLLARIAVTETSMLKIFVCQAGL